MARESRGSLPSEMPTTLQNIMVQINELQAKAEKVKAAEKTDVVGRIKEAIEVYGIEPGDLFGSTRKYQTRIKHGARSIPTPVKKAGSKRRARRFFTDEQKIEMVKQHAKLVASGKTRTEATKKVGVSDPIIRNWYKKFPDAAKA